MKEKIDATDASEKKRESEKLEAAAKISVWTKIWTYQQPIILLFIGLIMSAGNGCTHPVVGIAFSKFMAFLGLPFEQFHLLVGEDAQPTEAQNIARGKVLLEQEISWFCTGLAILALVQTFFVCVDTKSYATLGTNVTVGLRRDLYDSIL